MPKRAAKRVDMLIEDALGCRLDGFHSARRCSRNQTPRRARASHRGHRAKVLKDRLRHFTRAGIVERMQFPEIPPRMEYQLTAFGRKFLKLIKSVEKLQRDLTGDQLS